MFKVYYATTNNRKVLSAQKFLPKYGIEVIQEDIEIPESRVEETEEIAIDKVLYAFNIIQKPVISLDAGFFIHALGGFPKTFVNFALKTVKPKGILKMLEGENRSCCFKHTLAYFDETLDKPVTFNGEVNGTFSLKKRGTKKPYSWSDLHFYFIPEGRTQTLAEMTEPEYHEWKSHDQKDNYYLKQFVDWLQKRNK